MDSAFAEERANYIQQLRADDKLRGQALEFVVASSRLKYSYNFDWLGLPIIQLPTDIVALQELIWRIQPRLIVETGVARGGSVVFSASILQLIGADGLVAGIDIDIRAPNRLAIERHSLAHRIRLIEGSSTDPRVVEEVRALAAARAPVLVLLDSLHTRDHVLRELALYSPLVEKGSYVVVYDTVVELMPEDSFPDRPWSPGNSPMNAVEEFLATTPRFEIDRDLEAKLMLTNAPGGYLKCVG
jgi:cephalosporin hydroxylase